MLTEPQKVLHTVHVLVVDDHPSLLDLFIQFLVLWGYSADKANDGREALEKFHHGSFDLVITNHDMPNMSGRQLTAEIKRIAPSMPVIMVSGGGRDPEQLPEGVDVYVDKPVTMDSLKRAVEQALAIYPRRTSAAPLDPPGQ